MRLFVAIELPASVIAAADAVGHALRETVKRESPRARLTWVPADRMHVTVQFLGDVTSDLARTVTGVLTPPFDTPIFTLAVGKPGVFPDRGAPRAFWVELTGGDAALHDLQRQVSARLDTIGMAPEPRPFRPHVTLGRVREPGDLRGGAALADLSASPPGAGRIDAITLFESRLSPGGPVYAALQRTPLRQE